MAKGRGKSQIPDAVSKMLAEAERQARAGGMSVDVDQSEIDGSRPNVDDQDLAHFPMTDLGNAERFVARHGWRFRHTPALGWLAYDGRRWDASGAADKAMQAAFETARGIQDEAKAIRGTDDDIVLSEPKGKDPVRLSDKLSAHGRASESAQRLNAIPKLAAPKLAVAVNDLDADPWLFNVENGTIVINRNADDGDPIEFRPHDPHDLITKIAAVRYDPSAQCQRYDRFLSEVQPLGPVRRFVHQWLGYGLTGETGEQKLCFWYGKGRNGKSTLSDAAAFVMGDYGETVPIETFLDQGRGRNAGAATPDLALLPSVRLLLTSEPEKNSRLGESFIKLVTGGEPIQARHLNRDYFKFRPSFKLTMSGNYRPTITGTDEGIWRRVVLVPWQVTVENPDSRLPEVLRGEASGILNRFLDGLRDYLENGLILPPEVADATQDYREDSDPLGRFLAFAVELSPGGRVSGRRMHEMFIAWARATGEREWSPKGLTMALKERGYRQLHSNGAQWLDCRLIRSEADLTPADPIPPVEEVGEL